MLLVEDSRYRRTGCPHRALAAMSPPDPRPATTDLQGLILVLIRLNWQCWHEA